MTSALPSTTALEMILKWSLDRPAWQRDALRRIMLGGQLDDKEIAELTIICKESLPEITRSIDLSPLNKDHLPSTPTNTGAVSLVAIKDVSGVNLLAPSQTLSLETAGITIIYGDNGTGKSGYSRILKRACSARHRGEILPDIYASEPTGPAAATIIYNIAGIEQLPIKWYGTDRPHSQLSAISIFDKDCASIHIEDENEVAFLPFGLDIPDELVRVSQSIENTLKKKKKSMKKKEIIFF